MSRTIIDVHGSGDEGVEVTDNRRLVDVYPEWKANGYIVRLNDTEYKVKSLSRPIHHHVNIDRHGFCGCEHYQFHPGTRKPCIHLKLAMLDDTNYRKRQKLKSKEAMCVCCQEVKPRKELYENHDLENMSLYLGDLVCGPCRKFAGVA